MASQVLSGSSNVSYTNNTGQNVRIVINFMATTATTTPNISINWGSVNAQASLRAIGRNLAFWDSIASGTGVANNALGSTTDGALPTELMLAPGQTFSAACGPYNIVVIPEAG